MEIIDQTAKVVMLKGEGGDSIKSIDKTSTQGLVDVYTITLESGKKTTFNVKNGNGIKAIKKTSTSGIVDTYTVTFDDGETTTFTVTNGKGIKNIVKASTSGLVDTYKITYNDGTTQNYTVTNGAKGDKGDKGDTGAKGDKGEKGEKGDTGSVANSDTALSETSTNPVENQAITKALYKIRSHVGQVIMSTALDTEAKVIDIYGGTKWTKIEGRFLLGASNAYPINTTGGSADSVVVSHTHGIPALSGTAASNGAHSHRMSGRYSSIGNERFEVNYWAEAGKDPWLNGDMMETSGAHTHSVTTNASTTGSQGVSGTGKNMPPYKAVYIWERIQ